MDDSGATEPIAPTGGDRADREGPYAEGRRTDRTYVSRSFSVSDGHPARFVYKVFDPDYDTEVETYEEGTQWLVRTSPRGRVQIKLLVSREAGHVTEVMLQRVRYLTSGPRAETLVTLSGPDAERLVELLRAVEHIPVAGDEGIRVDDALVRDVFSSPESLSQLYERDRDLFRTLIRSDTAARDVVALARRRAEVLHFRRLLGDEDSFDEEVEAAGGRPEEVWQKFFETNPWILGTGLGGQLYTSWDEDKLEQVVAGTSISRQGRRADAVMRTSGAIRWMTFAEFKTHRTLLLGTEYRPGVWAPSRDLVGGAAQAQSTVQRAVADIGAALRGTARDGSELPGDVTFLTRPRSFLVIGDLGQLLGEAGGPNPERIRSFETYRRTLAEPEIVTFDELLARAEWIVNANEAG